MTESSPNWDEIFHECGSSAPSAGHACRVVYEQRSQNYKGGDLGTALNELQLGEKLVVIHNVADLGKLRRLVALLFRESAISKLEALLRAQGLRHVRSYGVYPNLAKIGLVYERHSAAGTYAEANLLAGADGRLRKFLQAVLNKMIGGPTQVDVIVVLGQKA